MSTPVVNLHGGTDAQRPRSLDDFRIVAIGGGTGLPVVLEGLKHALYSELRSVRPDRDRDRLTAIVTVADDGGSSGRLRQAYGVLPPGDVRNCLLALADSTSTLAALFDYRFDGGDEVGGHSLGNLILTALSGLEQDFSKAIDRGGEILGVRGRVLPSTTEDVRLRAEFDDGSSIEGESRISSVARTIRRVSIEPADAPASTAAIEAVSRADLVVIGPGSLYTSLIPVLLVRGLQDAIERSGARVVLVMNLTTQPGETDGYTAADHLVAIRRHAPGLPIHDVLLNAAASSRGVWPGRTRIPTPRPSPRTSSFCARWVTARSCASCSGPGRRFATIRTGWPRRFWRSLTRPGRPWRSSVEMPAARAAAGTVR